MCGESDTDRSISQAFRSRCPFDGIGLSSAPLLPHPLRDSRRLYLYSCYDACASHRWNGRSLGRSRLTLMRGQRKKKKERGSPKNERMSQTWSRVEVELCVALFSLLPMMLLAVLRIHVGDASMMPRLCSIHLMDSGRQFQEGSAEKKKKYKLKHQSKRWNNNNPGYDNFWRKEYLDIYIWVTWPLLTFDVSPSPSTVMEMEKGRRWRAGSGHARIK